MVAVKEAIEIALWIFAFEGKTQALVVYTIAARKHALEAFMVTRAAVVYTRQNGYLQLATTSFFQIKIWLGSTNTTREAFRCVEQNRVILLQRWHY
jgi:hypothetical protein